MIVDPGDRITAVNYAPDGQTRIGWLPQARSCMWMEENSKPGWATFEVPLEDAASSDLVFRNVVKLTWWRHGQPVATFACRISGETTQHAVDGVRWMRYENQPGVMAMLGDATVFPWQGIDSDSETTHYFGFMSPAHLDDPPRLNPWFIESDWTTPVARAWSATTDGFRDRKPHAFRGADPDAKWISLVDPDASQDADTSNYFRFATGVAETNDFEVLYSGDQYLEFWIDNRLVASGKHDWWTPYRLTVRLEGGDNKIFAVRAKNARISPTDRPNPAAFICTVRRLKPNGDPDGYILAHTDENWSVHADQPEPGWSRANVLHRLITQAKGRGISACDYVLLGFDEAHDSDGQPWTDRGQYAFDVGQVSVADVGTQLCETFMDLGMDPHTMVLHAYKRRGQDRSGQVQLTIGHFDGNLINYSTSARSPRFTVLITKTRDGSWLEVADPAAIGRWGRIERGMTLGGTVGRHTAQHVGQAQLDENGHARTYVTSESAVELGPVPYMDYGIGDTISVLRRRLDGYMTARVLAITVDGSGDVVRAWPEYVQDSGDG